MKRGREISKENIKKLKQFEKKFNAVKKEKKKSANPQ